MKLTKYEHACFTVEKDGHLIVVDPGGYSGDFIAPENVVAVVVTHQHDDHFDPDILAAIYTKNPDSLLLADQAIIDLMPDHRGQAVTVGQKVTVNGFDIAFFGGEHAEIHKLMSTIPNLGVLINDLLYYPGDSLYVPAGLSIDTLALPVSAPWLKISEVVNFLLAIRPRAAFPTHDAILSTVGKELVDQLIGHVARTNDIVYLREETLTI